MRIDHYFAYGSNMNVDRVRSRGLPFDLVQGARLEGFELLFDKAGADHAGKAHANIAPRPGGTVEGVLYRLPDVHAIRVMDVFERTPVNYSREVVRVLVPGGAVDAWTYIANPAVRRPGLRPERGYLEHLLAGAPYLSAGYVEWLRLTTVADDQVPV